VRSTAPGALENLPHGSRVSADSPRYGGVFNVVTESGADRSKARRLPTLFFGRAPIFVDRSIEKLAERLVDLVEIAAEAWRRPTYLLQPCKLADRRGLYARDLLNRSSFRARLRRLGTQFTEDPWVTFTEANRFNCRDWGDFEPSFVVTSGADDDSDKIMESSSAFLASQLTTFRMGAIGTAELDRLVSVCEGLQSAAADNPEAVVALLSE
jgi:hypothetical protein